MFGITVESIVSVEETSKVDSERSFEIQIDGENVIYPEPEFQLVDGIPIIVDGSLKVTLTGGQVCWIPQDPRHFAYQTVLAWEAVEGNERTYVPLPGGPLDV